MNIIDSTSFPNGDEPAHIRIRTLEISSMPPEPTPDTRESFLWQQAPYLVGALFGLIIWHESHFFTGKYEPWDSPSLYYSFTLVTAGFIASVFWERGVYRAPIGIFIGQMIGIWTHPSEGLPIFPAPVAVALFGTFQPICGAFAGWLMRIPFKICRIWWVLHQQEAAAGWHTQEHAHSQCHPAGDPVKLEPPLNSTQPHSSDRKDSQ